MVAATHKIAPAGLRVDFDPASDVVYVSLGEPVPDEGEDRSGGVILRYASHENSPSGVTIVGFARNGWEQNLTRLCGIIGRHLNADPGAVLAAIMDEVKK
jgi:hypothetical protein